MPFATADAALLYLLHSSATLRSPQEKKLSAMLVHYVCSFVHSSDPSSDAGNEACPVSDDLLVAYELRVSKWRPFGASAAGRSMELSVDLLANERNQWDQQEADVRRRGVVAVDGARAEQCDGLLTPRIELQMARQAVKAA